MTDPLLGVVYCFSSNGDFLHEVGNGLPQSFQHPRDITFTSMRDCFITDYGPDQSSRIVRVDPQGGLRQSFPLEGAPEAIAADSTGYLYIHIPASAYRVNKFSPEGRLVLSFGPRPKAGEASSEHDAVPRNNPMEYLSSIAVGHNDVVYFSPAWIYDVHLFTSDGKLTQRIQRTTEEATGGLIERWASGSQIGWTIIVSDICVHPVSGELLVLRGSGPNGGAVLDVWHDTGLTSEIQLDQRGNSVACDSHGDLYLLHASLGERVVQLIKYRHSLE